MRLANFGYFGHMWELYAMWTWAPVMIRASLAASGDPPVYAEVGVVRRHRRGRGGLRRSPAASPTASAAPIVASAAMAVSGACCLAIGFLYGDSPIALLVVAAIWGATVVADSAQFSACVTELGDPRYIGTALTMQTCIGFLITTISIRMMPALVARVGWQLRLCRAGHRAVPRDRSRCCG